MRIDQELVDSLVEELARGYTPNGNLHIFAVIAAATVANNLDRIATALEALIPVTQPAPEQPPEPDNVVEDYSNPHCVYVYCPHSELCRAHPRGCTAS
jgi:hypothetical protein